MDITSTNRFVDPAGCGSEFWRRCQGATDRLTRTTGFIDAHWQQNPAEAHTFHFVNVAVPANSIPEDLDRAVACEAGTEVKRTSRRFAMEDHSLPEICNLFLDTSGAQPADKRPSPQN